MSADNQVIKEYTNGETTVVWQPHKCIHTGLCLRGLPKVFNLRERPWINVTGASTEELEAQVFKCPSAALSIKDKLPSGDLPDVAEVTLIKRGPAIIKGKVIVQTERGENIEQQGYTNICRCGLSKQHPFCDGSHVELMKKK